MSPKRGAAFFDLDRTLLSGASGPVLSEGLRAAGLGGSRPIPGERFLFGLFNAIGETLPSMAIARQAVALAKGREQAAVRAAAEAIADELETMVQPFAESVFSDHREAGRPVVLATTTPYDMIKPLADRLGLDDVIATRYAVGADGTYDGTLDGPFVWSAGKLSAVEDWAATNNIELEQSFAYSDSVYDAPLLAAVGNPVVVNPDPRMVVLAAIRRWPTLNLDVAPGVAKVPVVGLELQQLVLQLARPALYPYAKFDISGIEKIPTEGPAIICANHRSYFDMLLLTMVVAQTGRTARFLGKQEMFEVPLVGPLLAAVGGISVARGSSSDEPLLAAAESLDGGEIVVIMPQGTIPRGPAFFQQPKGRHGAARLAQMTGAPIVPLGLWGTEKVWPRSSRLPNMLNVNNPPTVSVRIGDQVEQKGRSIDADTKRIMKAIVELLPNAARRRHTPTAEELALTYPPGYEATPVGGPASDYPAPH